MAQHTQRSWGSNHASKLERMLGELGFKGARVDGPDEPMDIDARLAVGCETGSVNTSTFDLLDIDMSIG